MPSSEKEAEQTTPTGKQKRQLVALDPEMRAVVEIDTILNRIEDPDMKRRVVQWMSEKHSRRAHNTPAAPNVPQHGPDGTHV